MEGLNCNFKTFQIKQYCKNTFICIINIQLKTAVMTFLYNYFVKQKFYTDTYVKVKA